MEDNVPLRRYTVEDYFSFPEDGQRYEILGGVLAVTPSPEIFHQEISGNLHAILWTYLQKNPIGLVLTAPMSVILAPNTVCEPDLLYISKARMLEIVRKRVWGAPDLVVEVLSPSTAIRDFNTKKQIYARHGVQEYWIMDPEQKCVHRYLGSGADFGRDELCGQGSSFSSPLFPDLLFEVEELFRSVAGF